MDNYKIGGNKDLARDPETNAIINVNSLDYERYIAMRSAKNQKNKVVDNIEEDLNDLRGEMEKDGNNIDELLPEFLLRTAHKINPEKRVDIQN